MYEQNKQASDLLDELYMEKVAVAFSGKKIEDVENGESYKGKDMAKDIAGNAAIIGGSKLVSKGMLAKGAYDLANSNKASSKWLSRAPLPAAIGTVVGLTGIGASVIKHNKAKNNNNNNYGQYTQASELLDDMYMEKQAIAFSGKRFSDIKDEKDYTNEDMLRDLAGNTILRQTGKIGGNIVTKRAMKKGEIPITSAVITNTGKILGSFGIVGAGAKRGKSYILKQTKPKRHEKHEKHERHEKKASNILDDIYMEKTAGIGKAIGRYKDLITGKSLKEAEKIIQEHPGIMDDLAAKGKVLSKKYNQSMKDMDAELEVYRKMNPNEVWSDKAQKGMREVNDKYEKIRGDINNKIQGINDKAREQEEIYNNASKKAQSEKVKRRAAIGGTAAVGVSGVGAGAYALKKHHDKKASNVLDEIYEKTAGVTNTPRLY